LYSWAYLHQLGAEKDRIWAEYQAAVARGLITEDQLLAAARVYGLAFIRLGEKLALIYRMEKFGLRKEQQEGSQPATRPQR
jgi:hypothetical protein